MEENDKILVLIDSNAVIHRSYHALPKTMSTSKGVLTNAVYGYVTTLIKVIEDLHPTHIAASFDVSKATFRLEQYKEYKAHRVQADQELYDQIPLIRNLLEAFNIPVYEMEGFEADDCIGTITDKFEEKNKNQLYKGFKVYIVTGDKDAFQLIDGNIFVYSLKKGLSQMEVVDREIVKKEWGLNPEDFIDLKALAGDPSDNIPGVPGIGPKTATELIQKFDTLKTLYNTIAQFTSPYLASPSKGEEYVAPTPLLAKERTGEVKDLENVAKELGIKPRILNLLIQYKDQAFLSQSLATIRRDVPLVLDLEKMKWGDYDRDKVQDFFEQMQFHSLLRRFGVEAKEKPKTKKALEQQDKDDQLKLL